MERISDGTRDEMGDQTRQWNARPRVACERQYSRRDIFSLVYNYS